MQHFHVGAIRQMAKVFYRHLDTSRETEESTKAPNVPSRADADDKQLGGWGGGEGTAEVLPPNPLEVQLGRDGRDRDF